MGNAKTLGALVVWGVEAGGHGVGVRKGFRHSTNKRSL
jgi:hypothetical protein